MISSSFWSWYPLELEVRYHRPLSITGVIRRYRTDLDMRRVRAEYVTRIDHMAGHVLVSIEQPRAKSAPIQDL